MNSSEQINELAGALAKAQGEMVAAVKDSQNPFFKSHYADLASVWDVIRKPLSDNGLSVAQTINARVLETVLLHASGQYISSELDLTPKEESSQAIGSAITYARRYSLSALVGVCADDDDGEGAMGRGKPIHSEAQKMVAKYVEHVESTQDRLCSIHNVPLEKKTKGNNSWWAHKLEDETWCNGRLKPHHVKAPDPTTRPTVADVNLPNKIPADTGGDVEADGEPEVPATVPQRQTLIALAKGNEDKVSNYIFDNWGVRKLKDLNYTQAVELEKILRDKGEVKNA